MGGEGSGRGRLPMGLGIEREFAWHAQEYAALCKTETRVPSPWAAVRAYFYASTAAHQAFIAFPGLRESRR